MFSVYGLEISKKGKGEGRFRLWELAGIGEVGMGWSDGYYQLRW